MMSGMFYASPIWQVFRSVSDGLPARPGNRLGPFELEVRGSSWVFDIISGALFVPTAVTKVAADDRCFREQATEIVGCWGRRRHQQKLNNSASFRRHSRQLQRKPIAILVDKILTSKLFILCSIDLDRIRIHPSHRRLRIHRALVCRYDSSLHFGFESSTSILLLGGRAAEPLPSSPHKAEYPLYQQR